MRKSCTFRHIWMKYSKPEMAKLIGDEKSVLVQTRKCARCGAWDVRTIKARSDN
jgi:hypothetical protein